MGVIMILFEQYYTYNVISREVIIIIYLTDNHNGYDGTDVIDDNFDSEQVM
jgi:hypothetical protein